MLNLRQSNQEGVFKEANTGHKMLGMGNIARQLLACLGAAPRLQGQLLPWVQQPIPSSIKYPQRNGDGSFFLQTPAVCSRLSRTLVGYGGRGEKGKRQERVKTGIRNFLKGSHLISWLTWLWLSPGWEWNVWCLGTRLILVTNLHLSFPLD